MRERGSERILVVDSDTEFRRSLVKTLLRAGYRVSSAASLAKAKELIATNVYSVIFVDPHMRQLSGFELLIHLTKESPSSKVIIVSVNGGLETDSKARETGVFAFLHKPVKRETLLAYTVRALKAPRDPIVQGRPAAHV